MGLIFCQIKTYNPKVDKSIKQWNEKAINEFYRSRARRCST